MTTPAQTVPLPDFLWAREAQALLTSLMERKGITFGDLAGMLTAGGTEISGPELETEVLRLDLGVGLFFQCLHALGIERVEIADIDPSRV
jgi:hypothetical protein